MRHGSHDNRVRESDAEKRQRTSGIPRAGCPGQIGLAACLLVILADPLHAQNTPSPTDTPAPSSTKGQVPAKKKPKDPFTAAQRREIEKLFDEERRVLAAQRETLEAAAKELQAEREKLEREKAGVEAQRVQNEERAMKLDALVKEVERHRIRLDEMEQSLPVLSQPSKEFVDRLARLEDANKKKPDLPADIVSAGDFPGSIRIPGSPAAIKFGGSVWVSAVNTLDALGSDDRFLTFSIPVVGDPGAEKGPRTSFWAKPSALNFDVRTKGPGDRAIRAFVEGDFAGASDGFRLRHAYVQVGGLLAGQTWSTFSDPDADSGDIDFEGVNAENVQRQAQFRYTQRLSQAFRLAASVEYPNASLTDTDGKTVRSVNQIPDLMVRGTWTPSSAARLQGSAVLRNIRGESASRPNEIGHETGWGLSASGTVSELSWAKGDIFTFQVNGGKGIARFISDLNSAGGQDGAFDPATGDLVLLRHWGWFGSYLHRWSGVAGMPGYLRSSLIWGTVRVDNLDFQPASAYKRTNRLSLNLAWTPFRNSEVGAQYIWGERVNKNDASGQARQFQLRARYAF
ncbi:MAG: porin [Acidobacteria bacterium]|nr:porin [Acidobacteriota bacterium]